MLFNESASLSNKDLQLTGAPEKTIYGDLRTRKSTHDNCKILIYKNGIAIYDGNKLACLVNYKETQTMESFKEYLKNLNEDYDAGNPNDVIKFLNTWVEFLEELKMEVDDDDQLKADKYISDAKNLTKNFINSYKKITSSINKLL